MRRPSPHPRDSWFPSKAQRPITIPPLASSIPHRLHDLLCGAAGFIGWGRVVHIDQADGAHVRVAVAAKESLPEPQAIDPAATGLGTRVEMIGDVLACERPAPVARRRTLPSATRLGNLSDVRILIVDDDELVRSVVGAMLERLRAAATVVSSPVEALWRLREEPDRFDVLVTDLTMPEMSGQQLFLRVREISPALPVVIISGDASDPRIKACLEEGARGFLAKPFTMAGFAQAIQEACGPGPIRS